MRHQLCYAIIFFSAMCCSFKQTSENSELSSDTSGRIKSTKSSSIDNSCLVFVGIKGQSLVFKSCDKSITDLYTFDNNSGQNILLSGMPELAPSYINNAATIFFAEGEAGKNKLIIDGSGIKKSIYIETRVISPMVDETLTFLAYHDVSEGSMIVMNIQNNVIVGSIRGAVPTTISSRAIHYEINSSSGDGYVDLFRSDLTDIYTKKPVVQSVYGEYLAVSSDGKYVACAIPIKGEPQYSIYNVEQKKYSLIKDPELNNENYYPILKVNTGRIVYYRPNNPKIKEIGIPNSYAYVRRD